MVVHLVPDRALLVDGSVVTVRELGPQDVGALLDLHQSLPMEDRYLRFFSTSPRQLEDFDEKPLRDVLLRVARVAELVPEIAELDLNPVIVTGEQCSVVDARVRVAPAEPIDPFLRRLRIGGREGALS